MMVRERQSKKRVAIPLLRPVSVHSRTQKSHLTFEFSGKTKHVTSLGVVHVEKTRSQVIAFGGASYAFGIATLLRVKPGTRIMAEGELAEAQALNPAEVTQYSFERVETVFARLPQKKEESPLRLASFRKESDVMANIKRFREDRKRGMAALDRFPSGSPFSQEDQDSWASIDMAIQLLHLFSVHPYQKKIKLLVGLVHHTAVLVLLENPRALYLKAKTFLELAKILFKSEKECPNTLDQVYEWACSNPSIFFGKK